MNCLFCQQICVPVDGKEYDCFKYKGDIRWQCLKCPKEIIYYTQPQRGLYSYMIHTEYKNKTYRWSFYPKAKMCYISIIKPYWSAVTHFTIINVTPQNMDAKLAMILTFM